VPNPWLCEGYASTSGVLERVSRLRSAVAMPVDLRATEETGLSQSIGRLFALAEDYPDLKASAGFQQLHASLVEIEDDLQYARRYYNGSVRDNNILVESFPPLLIAKLFGFHCGLFRDRVGQPAPGPAIELGAK
jgi:LemA protein